MPKVYIYTYVTDMPKVIYIIHICIYYIYAIYIYTHIYIYMNVHIFINIIGKFKGAVNKIQKRQNR